MIQKAKHKKTSYMLIVYAATLWGLCPIVYKYSLTIMGILIFLTGKYIFGAISIYAVTRKKFKKLSIKLYIPILLISIINAILLNVIYLNAVQNTSILHVAVISLLTPFAVYFYANSLLKETVHKNVIIGAVLSVIGLLIIIFFSNNAASKAGLFGDLLILVYVAINALMIVACRRLLSAKRYRIPPEQLAFNEYFIAGFILLVMLIASSLNSGMPEITFQMIWITAVAGIIFGALPNVLYYRAAKLMPAERLADTNFIGPLVAILSGVLIMGDDISTSVIIGSSILFVGLMISNNKIHPILIAHHLYMDEQLLIKAFRQPQKAYVYITDKMSRL